jgi:TonB family protein
VAGGKAKKILVLFFAAAALVAGLEPLHAGNAAASVVGPQGVSAKKLEKQFNHAAKDFHHGNLEKAEKQFEAVLAAQPDYPGANIFLAETHFLLGLDAADEGRRPTAILELKQALRLDPDEPYWHSTLAVLLEAQGDPEGAARECERAIKLSPDDAGLAAGCGLGEIAWPPAKHKQPPQKKEVLTLSGREGGVVAPKMLDEPQNQYSEKAKVVGLRGTVVVGVVIDAQGQVEEERVVRPLGLGLDELALQMVRAAKFEPALRHGVPVAVRVEINVGFEPPNGKKARTAIFKP